MLKAVLKMAPSITTWQDAPATAPGADAHVPPPQPPRRDASPQTPTWRAFSSSRPAASPDDADFIGQGKMTLHERVSVSVGVGVGGGRAADGAFTQGRPLCSPSRHVGTCFKCKLAAAADSEAAVADSAEAEAGAEAGTEVDAEADDSVADDAASIETAADEVAPASAATSPPPAVSFTIAEYMAAAACRPHSPPAQRDSGSSFASKTSLRPIPSGQALDELELSDEERRASNLPGPRFITAPSASFGSLAELEAELAGAAAEAEVEAEDGATEGGPQEPRQEGGFLVPEEAAAADLEDDAGFYI